MDSGCSIFAFWASNWCAAEGLQTTADSFVNSDFGKFSNGWANGVTFGASSSIESLTANGRANLAADQCSGWFYAGNAAGAATDLALTAGVSSGASAADAADITFGHGARHLIEYGLDQTEVESTIELQVQQAVTGAGSTGEFWGRVTVNGMTIEYRAYTLADGTINVGTYYVVP
jgi:hypothetical protein